MHEYGSMCRDGLGHPNCKRCMARAMHLTGLDEETLRSHWGAVERAVLPHLGKHGRYGSLTEEGREAARNAVCSPVGDL